MTVLYEEGLLSQKAYCNYTLQYHIFSYRCLWDICLDFMETFRFPEEFTRL